jgi:hypothetical protein
MQVRCKMGVLAVLFQPLFVYFPAAFIVRVSKDRNQAITNSAAVFFVRGRGRVDGDRGWQTISL